MNDEIRATKSMNTSKCLACGNTNLITCLDIGEQYLSSIFPDSLDYRNTFKKYPLELKLCQKDFSDRFCGLVQLASRVDLSQMYESYPYTSSSNESMKRVLEDVAKSGAETALLQEGDLILDIGGNDGTLLSFFQGKPYQFLVIDAAQNVEPVVSGPNFKFVRDFFSKDVFNKASSQKARLIFSVAMFYHLLDPVDFCRNVPACLEDDGIWIIQMAYLPAMIKTNMYDNIVHEHNGYYGIATMQWILDKAGLEIFDVSLNDVYGGSFRMFIKKKECSQFRSTERLARLLREELETRIFDIETYHCFDQRIKKTREDLLKLLEQLKANGKSVWIYGASTKGNTILQYCQVNHTHVKAAADSNPFKFGKYIIGADVPIVDEQVMRNEKPEFLLVLPYSFVKNFLVREKELVAHGTKFIVPLPEVAVL